MYICIEDFKNILDQFDILPLTQTLDFRKRWVELFFENNPEIPMHKCPNCKDYSKAQMMGYDWHGISYSKNSKTYQCDDYAKALNNLSTPDITDIVIFEENCVSSGIVVKFLALKKFFNDNKGKNYEDIYVTPKDFSWTLVLTHESGWVGPFLMKR